MATELNPTTGAAFLQRFYSPGFIANSIASKSSRLLGRIKRNPDCGGDSYNFLSVVSEIATGSASFSVAQGLAANSTQTIGSQFSVPYYESNEPYRVSGGQIAQTRNNTASWGKALSFAMDSALRMAAHRFSVALFTQGWGELGYIKAASVSGATFKMSIENHVNRVVPGMSLVYSSAINGAALRSATAQTVTGVDYSTGVITMSGNLSVPGGVAGDYVFCEGDRTNTSTYTTRLRPAGLDAWLPYQPVTDTTISTLYGVTRSTNTRNYGTFIDGTIQGIVDALISAAQSCSSVGNAGMNELLGVVSPTSYTNLSKALGGDRRYVDVPGSGGYVGFKTLAIMADGIEVPVISDKYCGDEVGFMVAPKKIELNSCGPAPHINVDDGRPLARISDDNGVEGRIVSYSNYAVKDPAVCARIQFIAVGA